MIRRLLIGLVMLGFVSAASAQGKFRAGLARIDVTPERFPVAVNCGFAEATGTAALDRLHARAMVLDDGTTRLAIVVVDNCMMPREFLDKVKLTIRDETGIPTDKQLIAATHTHTAPAVMGCLGSDPDPAYAEFLSRQLVRVVRQAVEKLTPAEVGWVVTPTEGLTHNRQWILRADRVRPDPFGKPTVRSNMHPGYQNPDFVGPSGPVDPGLSILTVRSTTGKPLGMLANFSMHYFGSAPVSADYFGRFCGIMESRIGKNDPDYVAIMSQGTSGDLHWMNYAGPMVKTSMDGYATAVADVATPALAKATYKADPTLAMAETTVTLGRRVPDDDRLAWARPKFADLGGKKPTTQPDIYAREAILLHEEPKRELKLQALRIGDLGIAAIPNEVFALTGLKLKTYSPLVPTFTMELANGADGYIPPAEQHTLGGYTTWPARSAGLVPSAEGKIVDTVLGLLEKVSGKPRRARPDPKSERYAQAVLADRPSNYWQLNELSGSAANDLAGSRPGQYETGVVFALEGPTQPSWREGTPVQRAVHLAGGRVLLPWQATPAEWSLEGWFWNGVPAEHRSSPSCLFALGSVGKPVVWRGPTIQAGSGPDRGKLTYAGTTGTTVIPARSWGHVLVVRQKGKDRVYWNGKLEIEVAAPPIAAGAETLIIGGTTDGADLFEGRVAEVALIPRPLPAATAAARIVAAQDDSPRKGTLP